MGVNKAFKLPLRTERSRLDKDGLVVKNPYLTFIIAKSELPNLRFAVIVSKKVSMLAVTRNKLKRQISAAIISLQPKIRPSDIIIIPRRDAINLPPESLKKQIADSLVR